VARQEAEEERPVVQISTFESLGRPLTRPPTAAAPDQPTDLDVLAHACVEAAQNRSVVVPDPPWLPPLPEVTVLPPTPDGHLPLALQDLPSKQAQSPLLLDLDQTGHLLIVGTARSGRTTALRTLAAAIARDSPVAKVHLYAIDAAGALRSLERLPQCGAVLGLDDVNLLARLLGHLSADLTHRQEFLMSSGCGSLRELRDSGGHSRPHIVVLLDGWEAFAATASDARDDGLLDTTYRLIRDGTGVGIHLFITAERAGLAGRLASAIDNRLVLRLADRADYSAAGVQPRLVPDHLPPGRGIWVNGGVECQVYVPSEDASSSGQIAALAALASTASEGATPTVDGPRRFAPPPQRVSLTEVTGRATGGLVLGVDLLNVDPISLDLEDVGRGLVVVGPPRSGRSTTLATVTTQLHAMGRTVVVVGVRPSPLQVLASTIGLPVVADSDDARLLHDLLADDCDVVVDDVELLVGTACAPVLDEHARRSARGTCVVAGGSEDVAVAFRGFVAEARRSKCGVLLAPHGPMDGEALGVRLRHQSAPAKTAPPGRGLLVVRGNLTELQVAMPV
jgi:S-DNA-T family DNA segregation ATPase FtsK/SpoIIIE